MIPCKLCNTPKCPKHDIVLERQRTINRILMSYKKDKKIYRITIVILFALSILTTAFGKEGVRMMFDFITKKFGGQ